MSKPDIEALKRKVDAQRDTALVHGVRLELPLAKVNAIIAALEDRERLLEAMDQAAAYCARATACGAVLRVALQDHPVGDG